MKRKRLDRDIWNFGNQPYYQLRVDTGEFCGLVCLLKLTNNSKNIHDGNYQYWNYKKAGRVPICGKGMTWLQLIPDGRAHIVTAMYRSDNIMSACYIDIIENTESDPDGVAVFIDKYLDAGFTPQGDAGLTDRDELDAAYESGELSNEQYIAALEEGERVITEYCSDIPHAVAIFDRILALVNEKIASGELTPMYDCRPD